VKALWKLCCRAAKASEEDATRRASCQQLGRSRLRGRYSVGYLRSSSECVFDRVILVTKRVSTSAFLASIFHTPIL